MPNVDIIDNPESGKIYLVKRNKSGDPDKRQQPATFIEFIERDKMVYAKVHWHYDGKFDEVLNFSGLFRTLTSRWMSKEVLRRSHEHVEAGKIVERLTALQFQPSLSSKIAS